MSASFKKRLQRIIYLLIFIGISNAYAQPKLLQSELDISNGLKSNTIRAIQKCPRDNSVWLGTEDGLTILNDVDSSYKKLTVAIKNKPVWSLLFYKNSAVIATRFNGIYFFDFKTHSITQHLDSSQIGLCRRIKLIDDTIYIGTAKKTLYLTNVNGHWIIHEIVTNLPSGFVTDFAKFNNKIYACAYAPLKSKLSYLKNDTLHLLSTVGEMNNAKELDHYFTLTNSDSMLVLGGSISYSIFKTKGNNDIQQFHYYKWNKVRPVWEAAITKKNVFLTSGDVGSLQEGVIYQDNISTEKDVFPNFYGQSLCYDKKVNGLWCGTLNRGLFYWPHIDESYKVPCEISADYDFIPANEDNLVLYNQKQASLGYLNKTEIKIGRNLIRISEPNMRIKDIICISNDSVCILYNTKVVIYKQNAAVWEMPITKYDNNLYNKFQYLNGRIILLAQYADQILSVDIKTKVSRTIKAPTNLTLNKNLNNGLVYFSNYSGFFYFDTIAHSLNLPILNAESFTLLHDTLFFNQGGVISGYKININNFSTIPIFNINLKELVPQFMPTWVIANCGRLYCGNGKSLLEINPKTGLPINYIYLGNYSDEKEPKSFGKYIYFNHGNYLTRINPIEENTFINKLDFKVTQLPTTDLDEKNPFVIDVLSSNYLLQSHTLKRLDLYLDGKLVNQFYSLSDEFKFASGLEHGGYSVKVFVNDVLVKELNLNINLPLKSNPYFYVSLTLIVLMIGFLLFKMVLDKRLYQKHILENRLQLLKQNLNPHFIFNSLNLIYSLVLQQKNDSAIRTINQFSDLHRYYLDNINRPKVNLKEELSFIRSYLQLESARVEIDDALTYFLPENLSDKIYNLLVPPMILQPLVENALKYSYSNSNENRTIWIDVYVSDNSNNLIIGIENTLPENSIGNSSGSGLGLKMVAERVEIFNKSYKEAVKMSVDQIPKYAQHGYRCELYFPFNIKT